MEQVKKTNRFELRLTDEQKRIMLQQASERNMNASQYFCYLLDREAKAKNVLPGQTDEAIVLYRDSDLSKILWHLAHWGNNLNQASNALNRIALKQIFSDAKNLEVLQKAAKNIQEVTFAARAFEEIAYELKEERHIVVDG